jgi:hypothetical protein
MRIVALSHVLRSVFLGLALAFWSNELQGKDYFITVGGGYTPQQNQASLEANVLFFQKILSEKHPQPLRHSVFFADGHDEQADLQVLSTAQRKSEPLRDLLSRLHRRGPPGFAQRSVEYRNHLVPNIAGANTPRLIHQAISKIAKDAKPGDRLLIYVTAHGGEGPDDNPRNTTISCWNNESITRDEFTLWLDELPDHVSVVLVMAQCYCGGFADTIFEIPKSRDAISSKPRIGFFAQQHNLPAAGCRPDIEHDQEFSSYFWGTIAGQSRNGEPLTGADVNGDSKISFDEAFANAVIIGDTIDIPLKTSDILLHRFSRIPDYVLVRDRARRGRTNSSDEPRRDDSPRPERPDGERSDEQKSPASESEQTSADPKTDEATAMETNKPKDDDSKLPGRMEGSMESLIQNADASSKRIVTELCQQLQIPLTDNVSQLMDRYAEQQRTQGGAFRGQGRRRSSSGRRELLAAIETQWPELADADEWSKSELPTNDDADELLKSIQELPEYATYEERLKQREQQSKAADTAELRTVRYRRLIDTLENIVLARNLSFTATPNLLQKYEDTRKLERMALEQGGVN